MKVLCAFETSGRLRDSFRQLGYDAWSCDVLPSMVPGHHLQCDVVGVLDEGWDLVVATPPCHATCNIGRIYGCRTVNSMLDRQESLRLVNAVLRSVVRRVAVVVPAGWLVNKVDYPVQFLHGLDVEFAQSGDLFIFLKNLPALRLPLPRSVRLDFLSRHCVGCGPTVWRLAEAMACQWGGLP